MVISVEIQASYMNGGWKLSIGKKRLSVIGTMTKLYATKTRLLETSAKLYNKVEVNIMKQYKTVRCLIGEILKSRKMTQKEFANKINFSNTYLNDIIQGRSKVSMNNAMTISKALNVSIEDLYEWESVDIKVCEK
jgi:DNA-binding XRE family transcriptional regulator